MTLHFFGDSLTAGYGVTETARLYYPWLVADWLGVPMVNHAVAGFTTADTWDGVLASGPAAGTTHVILIGENNCIHHGASASQLAAFKRQLLAQLFWLTSGKRTLQHVSWGLTGTWLNTQSVGKYTAGAGTATVAFSGDVLHLGYIEADWYAAGFTVSVDGQSKGSFSCLAPTILTPATTRRYAPALLSIEGCGEGSHTAVFTSYGASGSAFTYLDCVYDEPDENARVLVLTTPRGAASSYNGANWTEANVLAYGAATRETVALAQSFGRNVELVDVEPDLDPATCTAADGMHPNNNGHVIIAKALLAALA